MSAENQTFPWETSPEVWRGVKSGSSAGPGSVVALYIARQPSGPMEFVSEVRAFADRGLEGDRFFRASWMAANRPDKAVSLIEEETLQAAANALGREMFADETRRTIATCGAALLHLLPPAFTIRSEEHTSELQSHH